ncbi:MAG TPA: GNAT family N-acetyltransferase [Vicinamibacterales bacterium]|nr:GNAT family N-acetyltransferase [Vicinamibacterales bacterium]
MPANRDRAFGPDVEMRRATPADAPAMALAHLDSIRSLGPAFYEAELVDGWSAAVTPDMYVRAMAEGEVFFIAVAPLDGQPAVLGFSSYVPGRGDDGASVYVRGSAARQGLGRALWRLAEAHARAQGAAAITIEASLAGLAFYRALGFVEIGPCDVRLHSGASIPCVVMRKPLAGPGAE